jgi:hypothetical protein
MVSRCVGQEGETRIIRRELISLHNWAIWGIAKSILSIWRGKSKRDTKDGWLVCARNMEDIKLDVKCHLPSRRAFCKNVKCNARACWLMLITPAPPFALCLVMLLHDGAGLYGQTNWRMRLSHFFGHLFGTTITRRTCQRRESRREFAKWARPMIDKFLPFRILMCFPNFASRESWKRSNWSWVCQIGYPR